MIDVIFYFLLASLISFIGSLQPGPVNMAVVTSAAKKSYRNALYIAIGGSLPEFIFSSIALFASTYISKQKNIFIWFNYFLITIFLIAGLYLILTKSTQKNKIFTQKGFMLGLWVSSINPQLIFFWVSIFTFLQSNGYTIITIAILPQVAFVIGTSVGAFVLHCLLILFVKKYETASVINFIALKANKIIGYLLLILAILQIAKIMIKLF